MTQLITDRLILSPVKPEDYQDLLRLWSNAAFSNAIIGRSVTEEEVWYRLLRDLGHWQVKGWGNWSMRLKDNGTYLGSAGLLYYRRTLDPAFDVPEVGWGIDPDYHGKGLASEGVKAVLAWADANLPDRGTACMISPENNPSIKLALRQGFQLYAQSRYNGTEVNLYARPRSLIQSNG